MLLPLLASIIACNLLSAHAAVLVAPSSDDTRVVHVRIALAQTNLHVAEQHLYQLSDPDSTSYGLHWSRDQVASFFAPTLETVDIVTDWLEQSGVRRDSLEVGKHGSWLSVDVPLSIAGTLLGLNADNLTATSDDADGVHIKDGDRLPARVAPYVDFIAYELRQSDEVRGHHVSVRSSEAKGSIESKDQSQRSVRPILEARTGKHNQLHPALRNCSNETTPACLRALYNIPSNPYKGLNTSENAIGILEAQVYYLQSDLDAFFTRYAPGVPNGTQPKVFTIDNATSPAALPSPLPTNVGVTEGDIDLDMAFALVYPQPVTYYQVSPNFGTVNITGGAGFVQASLNFLDAVDGSYCTEAERAAGNQCGTIEAAEVISISYDTPEVNLTSAFLRRQCLEFLKLGLMGHTVVVASGDYGVASVPPTAHIDTANGCIDVKTGKPGEGQEGHIFSPGYPAGCPYVLTVGATQMAPNSTVHDPEVAMNVPGHAQEIGFLGANYSTSGGFSNVFPRPKYQCKAVDEYFELHNPGYPFYTSNNNYTDLGVNGGVYNRIGRAYPDVSANGARFATYVAGNATLEYGTSLAAPLWASLLTLLNAERRSVGKKPVGFVNPVLYRNPHVFHDISNGTNPGCGTLGFEAVNGWDPVTGLGTPDFEKLKSVFLSLP